MNTLTEFIAKLDKISFDVKVDRTTITSKDGWKLSYSIEANSLSPIQAVARLSYNDAFVTNWGCQHTQESEEFVKWFTEKSYKVEAIEYEKRRLNDKIAQALFNAL